MPGHVPGRRARPPNEGRGPRLVRAAQRRALFYLSIYPAAAALAVRTANAAAPSLATLAPHHHLCSHSFGFTGARSRSPPCPIMRLFYISPFVRTIVHFRTGSRSETTVDLCVKKFTRTVDEVKPNMARQPSPLFDPATPAKTHTQQPLRCSKINSLFPASAGPHAGSPREVDAPPPLDP